MNLHIVAVLAFVMLVFGIDGHKVHTSVAHLHSEIPFNSNGFWKTKWSWKGRWIKSWTAKKVWVPTWKRVWGPIALKEWVPLPPPHPPAPVNHLELPHVHLHSQW